MNNRCIVLFFNKKPILNSNMFQTLYYFFLIAVSLLSLLEIGRYFVGDENLLEKLLMPGDNNIHDNYNPMDVY